MAPRFNLTPIDAETELQYGMPFVIKWRNPATHRMDLWIGIHVPENIAVGISKPKGATADASEEAPKYVMYLPGRNTYRWIEIKCLYPLSECSPEEYEQAGRECPDIYGRLHAIADKTADIRFWTSFARKERNHKDRNDKVPSIDFSSAEASAGGPQESEAETEMEDDEQVVSDAAGDIEGASSVYSAGRPQGQMNSVKRPHREGSGSTPRKKAKTGATVGQQQHCRQQQQVPEPNGEEVVDIYIGNGTDQKVFHLTRNRIKKSSFLKGCIQGKFPYIMHPYLHQMTPAEFEPVHAFLSSDDGLDSNLVSVHGDGGDNDDEWEEILGDVDQMGKFWMLKDIHSIEDLKALLLGLRPTFSQASLLGLAEMADTVITKVQVAWNVYGRVEHLSLFLDFIESVMSNLAPQHSARGGQSSYGLGITQQWWIVRFLANTLVLYSTETPQRFWSLMDKYHSLRAAIFKHRGSLDDAKLLVLEKKFKQREPLAEASFVIPAKTQQKVEDEASVMEEAPAQMAEANE